MTIIIAIVALTLLIGLGFGRTLAKVMLAVIGIPAALLICFMLWNWFSAPAPPPF
jgi:hypothetical protein